MGSVAHFLVLAYRISYNVEQIAREPARTEKRRRKPSNTIEDSRQSMESISENTNKSGDGEFRMSAPQLTFSGLFSLVHLVAYPLFFASYSDSSVSPWNAVCGFSAS